MRGNDPICRRCGVPSLRLLILSCLVVGGAVTPVEAQPAGDTMFREWLAQHEGLTSFEVEWTRQVGFVSRESSVPDTWVAYKEFARYRWPDAFVQSGRSANRASDDDSMSRLGKMTTKRGVLPGGVWVDSGPGSDMYQTRDDASLRDLAWQQVKHAPVALGLWWLDRGDSPGSWGTSEAGALRGEFDFDGRPAAMVLAAGADGIVHLQRLEFLAADGRLSRWYDYADFQPPAAGGQYWWPAVVRSGVDVPEAQSDPILAKAVEGLQGRETQITRFTPLPRLRDEDLTLDLDGMLVWDTASGEVRNADGDLARLVTQQPSGSGPGVRWGILLLIGGSGLVAGAVALKWWRRSAS